MTIYVFLMGGLGNQLFQIFKASHENYSCKMLEQHEWTRYQGFLRAYFVQVFSPEKI